jgi:hypothetical protein
VEHGSQKQPRAQIHFHIFAHGESSRINMPQVKRNIAIMAAAMAAFLITIFFVVQLVTARPNIEYSISANPTQIAPTDTGSVNLQCINRGGRIGSFNLVLTLTNCTLSTQTEQPYTQTYGATVKFPFTLQRAGNPKSGDRKTVFFTINENATAFSFDLSLEKVDLAPMSSLGTFYHLGYRWNETSRYFERAELFVSVP